MQLPIGTIAGVFDASTLFLSVIGLTTLALFLLFYIGFTQTLLNALRVRAQPMAFIVAASTSFLMYALIGFGWLGVFQKTLEQDEVGWVLLIGSWANFFLSISMVNRILWYRLKPRTAEATSGGWQWVAWL